MHASINVESPARAAAALAELLGAHVMSPAGSDRCLVLGSDLRVSVLQAGRASGEIVALPVRTSLSVEEVIAAACAHGCHAEEVRHGVLEFWLGEWTVLQVITAEFASRVEHLPLAA